MSANFKYHMLCNAPNLDNIAKVLPMTWHLHYTFNKPCSNNATDLFHNADLPK